MKVVRDTLGGVGKGLVLGLSLAIIKIHNVISLVFYLIDLLNVDGFWCRNSYVGNISVFYDMEEKLRQVPSLNL